MSETKRRLRMKLIEAMKELRLIEKKMTGNAEEIVRYSSMVSTERPYFKTEEEQRLEVQRRVQANTDLLHRYLRLKQSIELTNLRTKVSMHGTEYSISELLVILRKMGQLMESTFKAMNDTHGEQRLKTLPRSQEEKAPYVVRFYDEKTKNEGLRLWQDTIHEISTRLEIVNATTELLEQ